MFDAGNRIAGNERGRAHRRQQQPGESGRHAVQRKQVNAGSDSVGGSNGALNHGNFMAKRLGKILVVGAVRFLERVHQLDAEVAKARENAKPVVEDAYKVPRIKIEE